MTLRVLPWVIWTLSALFVVFNYVHQVVPDVVATDLTKAFGATGETLGNVAALYFYAYAVLQIPVGLLVDRYGARWPLVFAIVVAALGAIAFSRAASVENAELARLIMGASSAFSFIGCLKLVQEWFPPARFSTLAGLTNTAGMIGAASGAPVAAMVNVVGWRATMAWLGWAELILAGLVFLAVRDRAAGSHSPSARAPGLRQTVQVIIDPQVWINAVYATTISLIFVAFGGLWGAGYIEKAYGVDRVAAANAVSVLFLGGIAGSLVFGWWSDYLGSRKIPMVLAAVGALITLSLLIYWPGLQAGAFVIGLAMVGFFSSANIVSYAVARDLHPGLAGLSIGFLSTCYYAGSAASQPLIGMLLQHRLSQGMGSDLNDLTTADYQFGFSLLVGFVGVALFAALALRDPLHPKAKSIIGPRARS